MLLIESQRALILKLANPDRVTDVIPSARKLHLNGHDLVAVPHRLDEARVLRNLGIEAPSPILNYYDWPGRYKPFDHQRTTAAFLTMNKKCLVLNSIGCVDSETEYLSPNGWVKISEYTGGKVAQYHPSTGKAEFVEPTEYVKKPCSNMIRFKTSYGVDQLLSPEHRVLYVGSTNKTAVCSAQNVLDAHKNNSKGWTGRIITTFIPPETLGISITDAELRLQVAVCADSYMPNTNTGHCTIRIKKERKKVRLRKLLNEASVSYKERECNSAIGFSVFTFVAPIHSKNYSSWAWGADNNQLAIIADEAGHWDGSFRKAGGVQFFTRNKSCADFIQYAFATSGRTASVKRHGVDYVVHARNKAALLNIRGVSSGTKTNCVYEQPSTDGYKYCFMVPSTFLVLRRNGCIFMTGNTGKTVTALWAADFLIREKKVKKVLIVSPLSTLERVWADSIYTELRHRTSVTLHGTAEKRLKLLKTEADFYIINHDGFGIIAPEIEDMFDLIIVDEAAVLRNPSTDRFKYLRRYMADHPETRLWLMTGTPTPNEPTDAWALAKLVNSPTLESTYTGFRDKVMMKVGQWKYIPRPNSADTVMKVLQPAIRFSADDCLDLPETVHQTREVPLTPDQKTYYKEMMKNLLIEAQAGQITAANEAVKMQKLVQISCGVAYNNEGKTVEIDCAPRVNQVKDLIEEAGGKVIVFVPLTGALHMLERELSKHFTVGVVNGEVSAKERNEIFKNFQGAVAPQVLLAHPATMAHGLTLTSASTIVWYGPITSNEIYTQANGRIERIGKRSVSNVIHIEATDLERKIYDRLKNKQKLQGVLLDLIQGEA